MFAIRILPPSERGPEDERLGEITIGAFTERFPCAAITSAEELEADWRCELHSLLSGEPQIAMVHDPRFAWIVYRVGNECYVQQHFSMAESFIHLPDRCTVNEDGERISEWNTSIAEIEKFLGGS